MKSNKKSYGLVRAGMQPQRAYDRICKIIEDARKNIARAINAEMVVAYWHIGMEMVEKEQRGKSRAGYGEALLKKLSEKLTSGFAKDSTNQTCAISGNSIGR